MTRPPGCHPQDCCGDPSAHQPAPQPPADRAALRDRIADVLAAADGWRWAEGFKEQSPTWQGYQQRADAVLTVLPETVDRAAVRAETLREAADIAESLRQFERTTGPRVVAQVSENVGILRVTEELRRRAGEQPEAPVAGSSLTVADWAQALTAAGQLGGRTPDPGVCEVEARRIIAAGQQAAGGEAHPAEHSWAAELYDPVADEWVPGTRYPVRARSVNALEYGRKIGPTWKDGTPTQRRLVRVTTTYTVEPTESV